MEGKQEDSDYLRGIDRPIGRQVKIRFDARASSSTKKILTVEGSAGSTTLHRRNEGAGRRDEEKEHANLHCWRLEWKGIEMVCCCERDKRSRRRRREESNGCDAKSERDFEMSHGNVVYSNHKSFTF